MSNPQRTIETKLSVKEAIKDFNSSKKWGKIFIFSALLSLVSLGVALFANISAVYTNIFFVLCGVLALFGFFGISKIYAYTGNIVDFENQVVADLKSNEYQSLSFKPVSLVTFLATTGVFKISEKHNLGMEDSKVVLNVNDDFVEETSEEPLVSDIVEPHRHIKRPTDFKKKNKK